MLDQEPLWYPSRNRFAYNPAIPDRQLWAIGMVAVQWGMTEMLVEQQIHSFINGDLDLVDQYQKVRSFRATLDFFQEQIELKAKEPLKSNASVLIGRIRNLSSQRHEIMHRIWGGGMPTDSRNNPENLHPEADAALLRQLGDRPKKTKSDDGRANLHWRLTFGGIRKIAVDIATLNRDLFMLFS